ncbi:MAG: HAD family phosphatase [Selenomonadaceae bacterium]|nr:HAD family phosphatase [Selenomonadaceae bacterium]
MKRGAIFDMDGTLFDTEKLYRQAWLDVAEEFGEEKNYDLPTAISGSNLGEASYRIIRRFYPNIDVEAYLERVLVEVRAASEKNLELMTGVKEILEFFKAAGVKMAVASSAPVATIEKNLVRANLRGYFEVVVGGDLVANGKPAPDIFLLAAKNLNLPSGDCYIFEDSLNGIRSAAAAGGVAVMIPDQVQPTEEIKKLCAAVFPNLNEARLAIERGDI